jgi:hypothetical protein
MFLLVSNELGPMASRLLELVPLLVLLLLLLVGPDAAAGVFCTLESSLKHNLIWPSPAKSGAVDGIQVNF